MVTNKLLAELLEQVFYRTLGIKKDKNEKRGGNFADEFKGNRLGKAVKIFKDDSRIPKLDNIDDYKKVIRMFYDTKEKEFVREKMKKLFVWLKNNGLVDADLLIDVNDSTLSFYIELLIDIVDFYFGSDRKNTATYSIKADDLNKLKEESEKSNRMASWLYYKDFKEDIQEILRKKDPLLYQVYDREYLRLFNNILENKRFETLSKDEKIVFIDILYTFSDLLDQQHHKDAFMINLDILTYYNDMYKDSYETASLDDLRKIQGCIYGLALHISSNTEDIIELTQNKNLRRSIAPLNDNEVATKHFSCLEKCSEAIKSLENLKTFSYDDTSELEWSLSSEGNLLPETIIKRETILSLIYSNEAAINMQIFKIMPEKALKDNIVKCQDISHDIKYRLWKYYTKYKKHYDPEIIGNAESLLASFFNTLAYRYELFGEYNKCIVIRNALFSFFSSKGMKEKANIHLKKTPDIINKLSEYNYKIAYDSLAKSYNNDFIKLGIQLTDFDIFKSLVKKYKEYVELFQ